MWSAATVVPLLVTVNTPLIALPLHVSLTTPAEYGADARSMNCLWLV
jgi:hypothetical protein